MGFFIEGSKIKQFFGTQWQPSSEDYLNEYIDTVVS